MNREALSTKNIIQQVSSRMKRVLAKFRIERDAKKARESNGATSSNPRPMYRPGLDPLSGKLGMVKFWGGREPVLVMGWDLFEEKPDANLFFLPQGYHSYSPALTAFFPPS